MRKEQTVLKSVLKRIPAFLSDVQNLCPHAFPILFPALKLALGKSPIRENAASISGLGKGSSGAPELQIGKSGSWQHMRHSGNERKFWKQRETEGKICSEARIG